MLKGKKIILGVTAGIAAYKAAILVRLLVKSGAEVKVIFTPDAHQFVTPLTFSVLSKNPVLTEFSNAQDGTWNNHVDLAGWADLVLIAPATANTLAKMAGGFCDNLLLAVYLSAKCPVCMAPAMDLDMYKHPSVIKNLSQLKSIGIQLIAPEHGELASGLVGEGRMAEPENIMLFLEDFFLKDSPLKGKKALVTAGPTFEAIDPVRFIGNSSTGKMGYAIADALSRAGAEVTLVSGPTSLCPESDRVKRINVESADEMFNACDALFDKSEIAVFSAAVADFKPKVKKNAKIKKDQKLDSLDLVPTVDVLGTLSKRKKNSQLLVGFALETDNATANAMKKLKGKNLDFVVLNSLEDKGAGFKGDTNKITIIDSDNKMQIFELKSKKEVAQDILHHIIDFVKRKEKQKK